MKLDKQSELKKNLKRNLIHFIQTMVLVAIIIALAYFILTHYVDSALVDSMIEKAHEIGWFKTIIFYLLLVLVFYVVGLEAKNNRKRKGNLDIDQLRKQEKISDNLSKKEQTNERG